MSKNASLAMLVSDNGWMVKAYDSKGYQIYTRIHNGRLQMLNKAGSDDISWVLSEDGEVLHSDTPCACLIKAGVKKGRHS